jgi:hypothetical protein
METPHTVMLSMETPHTVTLPMVTRLMVTRNETPIPMKRLDFALPDFTRLIWASDSARNVWEPRLSRITKAWFDIEWMAVVSGIRPCAVTVASPEEFVNQAGRWAQHGLNALPVETLGLSNYSYSSTGVRTEFGKPFAFRFVLGKPDDVSKFKSAWDASNQQEIGQLLGYPPCCREFFRRVWVDWGMTDTTWPMAVATVDPPEGTTSISVTGPPQANILWRWMGARPVPHLPCRFDCKKSVELGQEFILAGRDAGYGTEMDWLLEILSWPVEWSALHGIAEIKTPILKVSSRTDATPHKYVVRREGTGYPAEGAQGLSFPYRTPPRPLLTVSRAFQRGLDNPIHVLGTDPKWYATDNGFHSSVAMQTAHKPIIELATTILCRHGGNVLDLGCGNGALLRKIQEVVPKTVPFGIEFDPNRLEHARVLNPEFADNFTLGDLFESDQIWSEERRYALAIFMPGRLLETDPDRATKLKERLRDHCDHVLVYAYEDWLTRYENLAGLAQNAGIRLLSSEGDARASLASIG